MSRLRSEHLPVRYCKRPSQIFLGAAPLGDRVSVARYRFVSVSLSQAQCCGGYIDYSGVLAVLKFPLLQSFLIYNFCFHLLQLQILHHALNYIYSFPNSTESDIFVFRGQPGAGSEVLASQKSSRPDLGSGKLELEMAVW